MTGSIRLLMNGVVRLGASFVLLLTLKGQGGSLAHRKLIAPSKSDNEPRTRPRDGQGRGSFVHSPVDPNPSAPRPDLHRLRADQLGKLDPCQRGEGALG